MRTGRKPTALFAVFVAVALAAGACAPDAAKVTRPIGDIQASLAIPCDTDTTTGECPTKSSGGGGTVNATCNDYTCITKLGLGNKASLVQNAINTMNSTDAECAALQHYAQVLLNAGKIVWWDSTRAPAYRAWGASWWTDNVSPYQWALDLGKPAYDQNSPMTPADSMAISSVMFKTAKDTRETVAHEAYHMYYNYEAPDAIADAQIDALMKKCTIS